MLFVGTLVAWVVMILVLILVFRYKVNARLLILPIVFLFCISAWSVHEANKPAAVVPPKVETKVIHDTLYKIDTVVVKAQKIKNNTNNTIKQVVHTAVSQPDSFLGAVNGL